MQGTIFDIKHYAIHDGPGIRQTIFFKACPLSCWWCHNPESRSPDIFTYQKEETIAETSIIATEAIGKKYSIDGLMKEIEKDQVLYEESGGGVTISGGEPLMQFDFLLALLKACKKKDIHCCLDTTAYTDWEKLSQLLPLTDIFLVDLKHIDDTKHQKYTGVSNKKILKNIRLLDGAAQNIWFRYPLIPSINDDESDLLRTMAFLNSLRKSHPISILPYHKIGSQKYSRFGMDYHMQGVDEPSSTSLDHILHFFKDAGFDAKIGG